MKKENLLKSAAKLKQPSGEAIAEFTSRADSMTAIINDRLSQRNDLVQLIGEGNVDMMYDNHRNHLRFMISLFNDFNPDVFTETVLWESMSNLPGFIPESREDSLKNKEQ